MNNKKIIGILLLSIGIILLILLLGYAIRADYSWNNNILYNWNLADKSSTLEAKATYIDSFILSLEKSNLAEYDAIILKTPDNNVQKNIDALKTLRTRLDQIKNLDPESFAYQTSIQQITAQEQGEAQELLSVINGGYLLANYPFVWGWIGGIFIFIIFILIAFGSILTITGFMDGDDNNITGSFRYGRF